MFRYCQGKAASGKPEAARCQALSRPSLGDNTRILCLSAAHSTPPFWYIDLPDGQIVQQRGAMLSHMHTLAGGLPGTLQEHCWGAAECLRGKMPVERRGCGPQMQCQASHSPDTALLERPGSRKRQDSGTFSSDHSLPADWLKADQGDVSQHNQALLRWLDGLTEELEAAEAKAIESELQRTVETALRKQAEHSASDRPARRDQKSRHASRSRQR